MAGLTAWLLAPLHLLALATPAKSFRDNPILGSPRLNRMGLHLWRRNLAARMGARRRQALAHRLSAADLAAFERDGFLVKPDFLPPEQFRAVQSEVLNLAAPAREFMDGYTLTRLFPLDAQVLPRLPATHQALTSERYLALHDYAGAAARKPHLFVQTVFSRIRDAVPDVQSHFHSDTFQPTVKSWLFLNEVPEDAAAFTYVPGSHRANRRRLAWERRVSITARDQGDRLTAEGSLRISEEMLRRLGYPDPVKLAVAPNTLVIADTSGFHRRGISASQACRISIWAYARSNPFLPWTGAPQFPALHGRAVRLFWGLQDVLRRITGGGAEVWRWVGPRSPATPPG